jgi:hypothetical protein
MRVLHLKPAFFTTRRVHAPPRSAEDEAVRRALRDLADDRLPAPAPGDTEALRTPFLTIWARSLPGTNLVITYVVTPRTLDVIGVRPQWREHR